MKNASPAITAPPAPRCIKVANAISMSDVLVAFTTKSSQPRAWAAVSASATSASALELVGLTSRPSNEALVANVCNRPSRFDVTVLEKKDTPVALPSGWLRLETTPRNRITGNRKHNWDHRCSRFSCQSWIVASGYNQIYTVLDQ